MGKLKTLIAEDAKTFHVFYNKELDDAIFEKRFTVNGEEALAVYDEWRPDLILLDLQMPVMTGLQALETIRKVRNDRETTIVMATGMSEKADILACVKLGIQGYIMKPFNKELPKTVLEHYKSNMKRLGKPSKV